MKRGRGEIVARTSACAVWFLWQVSVGWKRIHTRVSIIKQTRGASAAHRLTLPHTASRMHKCKRTRARDAHAFPLQRRMNNALRMWLTRGPRRERQIGNEGWWMVLMGLYLRDCRGMWRGEAGRDGERVWNTLHPNSAPSVCVLKAQMVAVGVFVWESRVGYSLEVESTNESRYTRHALLPSDLTSQSLSTGALFIEPLFLALYNLSPPGLLKN